MDTAVNMTIPNDIIVLDKPIETDDLKWLADHPECDSIIDHIGRILRVYAYATKKSANRALAKFRDTYYAEKTILAGVSQDGINCLF